MNHRRLCKRITNLDRYYLAQDRFSTEAMKFPADSIERRELSKVADRFGRMYDRMVKDLRRTDA